MIKVDSGSDNDGFRAGVGSVSSATNGQGIDELFLQQGNGGDSGNNQGNHVNFLDDAIVNYSNLLRASDGGFPLRGPS